MAFSLKRFYTEAAKIAKRRETWLGWVSATSAFFAFKRRAASPILLHFGGPQVTQLHRLGEARGPVLIDGGHGEVPALNGEEVIS